MKLFTLLSFSIFLCVVSCKTSVQEVAAAPKEEIMAKPINEISYQVENLEDRYYTNSVNKQEMIKLTIEKESLQIVEAKFLGLGSEYPIELTKMEYSDEFGIMGVATSKAWEGEAIVGLTPGATELDWSIGKSRKIFQL